VRAALNHATGAVHFRRATTITTATLVSFYQQIRQAYPQATRIYVIQATWPVHHHPDVCAALVTQASGHCAAVARVVADDAQGRSDAALG